MQTQLWWVGVDGSAWNLLTGEQGMLAQQGVKGLKLPTFKNLASVSARQDGQVHRGTRWDPRTVVLPYFVGDVGGVSTQGFVQGDWRALDRAVEQSMSTEAVAWLTVVSDVGGYRTLQVRLAGAPTELDTVDPGGQGAQHYSADFIADMPWYQGIPIKASFSGAGALGTASVGNPGDRDTWPVFTVYGPGSYTIGCDPARLTTILVAPSQSAVYDTDPQRPTLIDNYGTNLWPYLTSRPLRSALPPGPSRPLYLYYNYNGTATPQVDVSFTPRYAGPW